MAQRKKKRHSSMTLTPKEKNIYSNLKIMKKDSKSMMEKAPRKCKILSRMKPLLVISVKWFMVMRKLY